MDGTATQQPGGLPQFTPEFVAEVDQCETLDSFRELLNRKGLWLNRWAAIDVFGYLRSLASRTVAPNGAISDEQLAGVVGGTGGYPPVEESELAPILMEVIREL